MAESILFERIGSWGRITLNRPDTLNALTLKMIKAFRATLDKWRHDPGVRAILVRGAGERAFCSGADIRSLQAGAQLDPAETADYFREEYALNAEIFNYPKPYLSLIDGIVMGGGAGVSIHGDYRVAGDKTMFAMPETQIGLFPDVGGGYFLPRLDHAAGWFLGLTGGRARTADAKAFGIATHVAASANHAEIELTLLETPLGDAAARNIEAVLDQYAISAGKGPIALQIDLIERVFGEAPDLPSVFDGLKRDGGVFAQETLTALEKASPLSLAVTFELLSRGEVAERYEDVARTEFRLAYRFMQDSDFIEGVRAQLIDKDRNPQWGASSIDEISPAQLAAYFEPLGEAELDLNVQPA